MTNVKISKPTIVYDTNILEDVKDLIRVSLNKLKSLIFHKDDKYTHYFDLKDDFNDIALLLDKSEFHEEFSSFLSIKSHILHIIYRNHENQSFGHFDFAIKLLDLFQELLDEKIRLLKNNTELVYERYADFYKSFQDRLWDLDKYFYNNIYEPVNNDISKKEAYNFFNKFNW